MNIFLEGLLLGFSLIAAIGPQNAFVLKQGLKRQHVFLTAFMTSACDAVLIALAVFGAGRYLAENPTLKQVLTIGGIAFLAFYGTQSFRSVFRDQTLALGEGRAQASRMKIVLQAIAFSWINPHALLDVVVIMGSVSCQYNAHDVKLFGLGCIVVSFVWFFLLAFAAKKMAHHFQNPRVWKVIDFMVGGLCYWIAWGLIRGMI